MIEGSLIDQSPGYLSNKPATQSSFMQSFDRSVLQGLEQKALSVVDAKGYAPYLNYLLPNNPVVGNWEIPQSDRGEFTREQALARMQDLGVQFDVPEDGMARGEFAVLAERDLQRQRLAEMEGRASDESFRFLRGLAGGLAGGLADPFTTGLAVLPMGGFVPGVGFRGLAAWQTAKAAALEEAPGALARLAVRTQFGAQEAFAGSVIGEAINSRLIAKNRLQEQDVDNPVTNVIVGTAVGTTFGAFGGAVFDAMGLSPHSQRTIAKQAEVQALSDQPINVAPTMVAAQAVEGLEPGTILEGTLTPPAPLGPKIKEISLEGLLPSRRPLEKISGQIQRARSAGKTVKVDGVPVTDFSQWHDRDGQWWFFDLADGQRIMLENEMVKGPGERRARITIETPRDRVEAARQGIQSQLEQMNRPDPGMVLAAQEHAEQMAKIKAAGPEDQAKILEGIEKESADVVKDLGSRRAVLLADERSAPDVEASLHEHGLTEEYMNQLLTEADEEISDSADAERILQIAVPCAGRRLG